MYYAMKIPWVTEKLFLTCISDPGNTVVRDLKSVASLVRDSVLQRLHGGFCRISAKEGKDFHGLNHIWIIKVSSASDSMWSVC